MTLSFQVNAKIKEREEERASYLVKVGSLDPTSREEAVCFDVNYFSS